MLPHLGSNSEEKERERDDSHVATKVNSGVASFMSWSKSMQSQNEHYGNCEALNNYCLLSKVNTLNMCKQAGPYLSPQKQALGFPHGSLKLSNSPDTPTMIEWIIDDREHKKSSARKVTHLSIILALGN